MVAAACLFYIGPSLIHDTDEGIPRLLVTHKYRSEQFREVTLKQI